MRWNPKCHCRCYCSRCRQANPCECSCNPMHVFPIARGAVPERPSHGATRPRASARTAAIKAVVNDKVAGRSCHSLGLHNKLMFSVFNFFPTNRCPERSLLIETRSALISHGEVLVAYAVNVKLHVSSLVATERHRCWRPDPGYSRRSTHHE